MDPEATNEEAECFIGSLIRQAVSLAGQGEGHVHGSPNFTPPQGNVTSGRPVFPCSDTGRQ
jgi:hypothetical protein